MVKDDVARLMAEDEQRQKLLAEMAEELKSKDQFLKTQREELVALRQEILEHERKAACMRQKSDPRLLSQKDPMVIYMVKAGKSEKVPIEVWPHEHVWKLHQIGCRLWDCGFDATYLAVGDITLEDNQIVQEVMQPGEQAELKAWWPEDKETIAESITILGS